MGFIEEPLFGEPGEVEPANWPPLPKQPWWRRFHGDPGVSCDYCRRAGATVPRRVVWHRTGIDGALLLLCDRHAELFGEEGDHDSRG